MKHKYIRTDDVNYLIIDLEEMVFLPYTITDGCIDLNSLGRFEIVKKANTIEKLVDTFVICYPDEKPCIIGLTLPKKSRNYFIKETDVEAIYGAIWTDKGLIFVAKMNEKGEFELL